MSIVLTGSHNFCGEGHHGLVPEGSTSSAVKVGEPSQSKLSYSTDEALFCCGGPLGQIYNFETSNNQETIFHSNQFKNSLSTCKATKKVGTQRPAIMLVGLPHLRSLDRTYGHAQCWQCNQQGLIAIMGPLTPESYEVWPSPTVVCMPRSGHRSWYAKLCGKSK